MSATDLPPCKFSPGARQSAWLPAALALATLLLAAAQDRTSGADLESDPNVPSRVPPLKAEVRTETVSGLAPIRRVWITANTNQFAFVLPDGYRLETSDPSRVALVSPDYNCLMSFRIASPARVDAQGPPREAWRQALLSEHPGTRLLQDFALSAAGRSGPAFDVHWKAAGGLERLERVAFTPSLAGVLEFRLTCSTNVFRKSLPDYNFLLLTFRAADAAGKLELPQFSNKF